MPVSIRKGRRLNVAYFGDLGIKFVRQDKEILERYYRLKVLQPPRKVMDWPGFFLRAMDSVRRCDFTFSWFAGWHSLPAVFFSRLYGKRSLVVTGGFDVANLPEVGYGARTNIKERIPAVYCLKNADMVVPFSYSSEKELRTLVRPKKVKVVYCGVESEDFFHDGREKERMAITVGGINRTTLLRKGFQPFVETARHLPDVEFVVVGRGQDDALDHLRSIATDNVTFTGFASDEELLDLMRRSSVYVQASAHEGFGISVAEGMLCECIPVTTHRFSLPEVVGDTGLFVPFNDTEATAEAVEMAMKMDDDDRKRARARIIEKFPMGFRKKGLLEAIRIMLR